MANLSDWLELVVPEATINQVANPSFETDVSGWTATSGGVVRVVGGTAGAYAARFTATALNGRLQQSATAVAGTTGQPWTASAWVKAGSSAVTLQIREGTTVLASVAHSGGGAWEHLTITHTLTANRNLTVAVVDGRSSGWTAVDIDAVQLEQKAYATTYCDGDQDGCRWLGTQHLSRSFRSAASRAGGRPQSFRALGVIVQSMAGAGAPPMKNLTTDYEYREGASYQRTAVQARLLTLSCAVDGQRDVATLLATRDRLLRILMPTRNGQPALLRFTKYGIPVRLAVRYDGGLEMTDVRMPLEQFPVRLLAVDPLWESDVERAQALTIFNQLTIYDGLARRTPEGIWDGIGTQAGDSTGIQVNALAKAPDGTIYAGGTLTGAVVGGVTMALPLLRWDGTAWAQCGSGTTTAGASIQTIAIGPDGKVYVGGSFLTIGGVTGSNIAVYDPTANTWAAMGSGTNGTVAAVCVDTAGVTGRVWIGGNFTARGNGFGGSGLSVGPYCAYFDGTNWQTQISFNNQVSVITRGADGYLYFGGAFSTISDGVTTVAAVGIARWLGPYTGTGNPPGGLGAGVNAQVRSIWLDPDTGRLHVGGAFTTAGGSPAYGVAIWTGSGWQAMGGFQEIGAAADVFQFFKLANGDLLATGRFDSIVSGRPCNYSVARWTGADWVPLDGILQGSGAQYVVAAVEAAPGELIFGVSTTKTLIYYGPSNVVTAGGPTYPRVVLAGLSAGLVLTLVNRRTGRELVLDYQAFTGETLTLDLRPDRKRLTSSWKGDQTGGIPLGTALATWALEDGSQDVGLLSTAGGTDLMIWRDRHWSVDTVPLSS
jgi:hypothetical protein